MEDLNYSPEALFMDLQTYSDPVDFFHAVGELDRLREGFQNDMSQTETKHPVRQTSAG